MVYTLLTLNLLDRFTSSWYSHLTSSRHQAVKLGFSGQPSVPRFRKGQVSLSKLFLQLLLATQIPKCSWLRNLLPLWWGTGKCQLALSGQNGLDILQERQWRAGLGSRAAQRDGLPKRFPSFLISPHLKPLILLTQNTRGRVWSEWRKSEHKPNQPHKPINQTN